MQHLVITGIDNTPPKESFPVELLPALRYILDDISGDDREPDPLRQVTSSSIQAALLDYGYVVTPGQAEAVYSNYSFNKWASWYCDGCTDVDDAKLMLNEFCRDVLQGENHIGYGQDPEI